MARGKQPTRSVGDRKLNEVAGYRIRLERVDGDDDGEVVAALQRATGPLSRRLAERAMRRLGPTFRAEVRDVRVGTSVLALVFLGTVYGEPPVGLAPQFVAFGELIGQEIGDNLKTLGVRVEIDVAVTCWEPQPRRKNRKPTRGVGWHRCLQPSPLA